MICRHFVKRPAARITNKPIAIAMAVTIAMTIIVITRFNGLAALPRESWPRVKEARTRTCGINGD